jgi:hypothetical protein
MRIYREEKEERNREWLLAVNGFPCVLFARCGSNLISSISFLDWIILFCIFHYIFIFLKIYGICNCS